MKRNSFSVLTVALPMLVAVILPLQSAHAEKPNPKSPPPAARLDDDADDRGPGPGDRMGDDDGEGPPGRMDDGDWAGRPGGGNMDGPRGPRSGNPRGGPRGNGDLRGPGRPGMVGDAGGTAITVAGNFVYVVKGNTLYQFTVTDLRLVRQVQLAPSGPPERRPMGGRPGERPMGDRPPGDRPQRPDGGVTGDDDGPPR